jgi:hypothetical protein
VGKDAGPELVRGPGGFRRGFPRRISNLRGPPGVIRIETYPARLNTEYEDEVACCSEIVTISGADRLIGGGVVGFLLPPRT